MKTQSDLGRFHPYLDDLAVVPLEVPDGEFLDILPAHRQVLARLFNHRFPGGFTSL